MGKRLYDHLLLRGDPAGVTIYFLLMRIYLYTALLLLSGCGQESVVFPDGENAKTPIIIDADTANEVDDLFALAGALGHTSANDSIRLVGITSAQFHRSPLAGRATVLESQRINEDLIRLTGREDVALRVGSNLPLMNDSVPAVSAASAFIIEEAYRAPAGTKLQLFVLGSCTNAASAVLQDPGIIDRLHVRYLGFWHDQEANVFDKKEFNSGNDTFAVNVLLDTPGLEFTVMTATTSQHLVFDRDSVNLALASAGRLGHYLRRRWDIYDRWWTDEDPEKQNWIMWDVALIEAYFHPDLAKVEQRLSPPENTARQIGVYTNIRRSEMEAGFWSAFPLEGSSAAKSLPSPSR